MEEAYRSLIKKFYHAVDSGDAITALDYLSRLGRYGGFHSFWGDVVYSRGIRLVAIENTSEAASAIANFILLTKRWTLSAIYILKMTTPSARTTFDELINKAWDEFSRAEFVQILQEYDQLLSQRQKCDQLFSQRQGPRLLVFIDRGRLIDAPGCRIARVHKPVHWTHVQVEYDGWVKPDGGCTLGIDPVLEANTGELVFNTGEEASMYAKEHGWRDVGIYG
jgi:hypothetical protein